MNRDHTGLKIRPDPAVGNRRDQDFSVPAPRHDIHIICTGLHHVFEFSEFLAVVAADRKADQICDVKF